MKISPVLAPKVLTRALNAVLIAGLLLLASAVVAAPTPVDGADGAGGASDSPRRWRAEAARVLEEANHFGTDLFDLQLLGRVQVWGGWVGDDALLSEGDLMQEYGFRLRRARFGVAGTIAQLMKFKIELDAFDQETTGGPLYAAWIDVRPNHWIGARVGMQRYLYSKSYMQSSARLAHLDRGLGMTAMSPDSPVGLVLYTEPWEDHLTISLGVFNGLQRKAGFFEGYEGVGVSLGNRFERLSYVGRIDLEPMGKVGPDEADLEPGAGFRLGVGGGGFYNDGKSIETLGASGYLHLKGYGFHLFSEVLWDSSSPQTKPTSSNTITDDIKRMAVSASLGYVYQPWGLGLAVRGELIDANTNIDDEGDQIVVGATLTWYMVRHYFKMQLEYQHRQERYGVSVDNDAVILGVQLAL